MDPFETERLTIRNFVPDDWHELQNVIIAYQKTEAAKFEDPWPVSDDKMKEITTWFAGGDDYLAVVIKEACTLIGFVAIDRRKDREKQIHNLGYVFHPNYAGRGYATEACKAAMGHIFEQTGAEAIITGTHPDNKSSADLLKRLGLWETGNGEWTMTKEKWMQNQ